MSAMYDVIIPAYNAQAILARAIDSALAQTAPPGQVIVVDDGSRDATAAVAERYGPPVTVIQQGNAGPGAARNRGVQAAAAPWVAMLDADDEWLPTKMARQLTHADQPAVGIICCHSQLTRGNLPRPYDFNALWRRNRMPLSSAVIRAAAFRAVGGFSTDRILDPVADYHLWLRLVRAGWTIATVPECLLTYHITPGCLTGQVRRFAEAELACARQVGVALGLPQHAVAGKLQASLDEYGREALNRRDLPTARLLLRQALLGRPTPARLFWLLAAWVPIGLLDLRRRFRTLLRSHRP